MRAAMPDRREPERSLASASRGAVTLEFLLAFMPIFALFLGVLQLALIAAAKLVVRHAAVTAARAAVVVLEDDTRHYHDVERRRIDAGSPRMVAIRSAAHGPLTAIAPGALLQARILGNQRSTSAEVAVGDQASRMAIAPLYLPLATAVTFPVSPGGVELQERSVDADPVIVRVTHLMPCAVPIANRLLCDALRWNPLTRRIEVPGAPAESRGMLNELGHAPLALGQTLLSNSALPFQMLQGEAAMPAQRAGYPEPREREDRP
jgi:hypothetical protein